MIVCCHENILKSNLQPNKTGHATFSCLQKTFFFQTWPAADIMEEFILYEATLKLLKNNKDYWIQWWSPDEHKQTPPPCVFSIPAPFPSHLLVSTNTQCSVDTCSSTTLAFFPVWFSLLWQTHSLCTDTVTKKNLVLAFDRLSKAGSSICPDLALSIFPLASYADSTKQFATHFFKLISLLLSLNSKNNRKKWCKSSSLEYLY